MKSKLCLLLLAISTMLGCYMNARLYPVQGPLAAQTPVPVLMAKITGKVNAESISVVLSDGEECKGRWVFVNNVQSSKGPNSVTAPTTELSGAWDSIYGPNFYSSRIIGAKYYAQAVARGNRGTILNVELYGDKGVAKDDKGNIYKLVFQR